MINFFMFVSFYVELEINNSGQDESAVFIRCLIRKRLFHGETAVHNLQ